MNILKKNWWILALQGLFLIVLGLLAVFSPQFKLNSLVQFLGLVFLLFGALLSVWGWRALRSKKGNGILLFLGSSELALGILILIYPNSATDIFAYIIGGWAVFMGLTQFFVGRRNSGNRLIFYLNGLISVIFGLLIIFNPFNSSNALTYLVGFYSLLLGVFIIYYSFKFRSYKRVETDNETP